MKNLLLILFIVLINIGIIVTVIYVVGFYVYAAKIVKKMIKKNKIPIEINGPNRWDMQVYNKRLYREMLKNSSIGFGEGYMRRDWDTQDLKECLKRILASKVQKKETGTLLYRLKARFTNRQSRSRSFQVGEQHYDIGNDLYSAMLDPYMQYSCGYWETGARSLEEAQVAKLDLIANKLHLRPGMKILEIGCGFGGFMRFLQERYDVEITGLSVSVAQKKYAEKHFGVTTILIEDYRDYAEKHQGQYDRIYSVGMFEHVGEKNYRKYFTAVRKMLKKDGFSLLHTIGNNVSVIKTDPWINKYIFPNGMLPSISQIGSNIEGLFVMEDWHNFGPSYAKTLAEWNRRSKIFFKTTKNPKYNDKFRRMWDFYLTSCEVVFSLRQIQLWQVIITPSDSPNKKTIRNIPFGGYRVF
jgi:cyclopropane-fatty-acyl-phospholipid synthase